MRAMIIPRFGGPEVFEECEVDKPTPGAGQLLVRVIASGTNPVDAKLRANGTWANLEPPVILGSDASGVVEQVGAGVTEFKLGDEVFYTAEIFGNPHGTYAEYNVVDASIVAPKPGKISYLEAAAVPLAGGTAWEAIVARLQVRPGETVLIHGGAGGVGSFAIQLAKIAGARVLVTAGPANQTTLSELGVDVPIDYKNDDPIQIALEETNGVGVDAVFDTVGGDLISRSLEATRPFGRLAHILSVEGSLTSAYMKNLTLHGIFLTRERPRLEKLGHLLERDQLKPLVDAVLPLAQVQQAHERLDSGHGRGKVVLKI
ncbi:MAG: zinc-dependent alcohol dehydrogenase family protein [Abitibacteriaceae bacterium]|nr:zinc-dependent alcohol dehydrogenase family protein [Abditibacteriaceae bacterium]